MLNIEEVDARVQQAVADARQGMAADVDAILEEIRRYVEQLPADHFERLTRYEQWCQIRRFTHEKFDQRSPMRSLEAVLLRSLVRDAHDLLTNPETRLDTKHWTEQAEPFLRRDG